MIVLILPTKLELQDYFKTKKIISHNKKLNQRYKAVRNISYIC